MKHSYLQTKNIARVLLIILAFICSVEKANASHVVGGCITYQYLGSDSFYNHYQVTVEIYEDCLRGLADAIAQDNPIYINIFNGKGGALFPSYDSISLLSRSLIYTSSSSSCLFTLTPVCLQKAVFTKVYNLPIINTAYTIVMQRCCFTTSILNLVNPDQIGLTFFATIPARPLTNSSTVFKKDPPFYVHINQPFSYDLSARDADGDSLSYEFCQSYTGGSNNDVKPVPTPPPFSTDVYSSPYTYASPMSGSSAIQIDPVTGMISGTPNTLGRYFMSVCCHEWRAGIQINTIQRLFQLVVTNCASTDINDVAINEHQIRIFPNPASSLVNIKTDIAGFDIKISDIMGRVVFHESKVNTSQLAIPINTWAKGMYFVCLEFEDGSCKTDKLFVE